MDNRILTRHWIVTEWPRAIVLVLPVLIGLSPVMYVTLGPLFWVFFQLPTYMIHQYEEHGHGEFKKYVNGLLGAEALTDRDIAFINLIEVWGLFLVMLGLAKFVAVGFGLVPIYLVLFNAITHVVMALRRQEYNPGLWTSVGLFFPISIGSLLIMQISLSIPTWQHCAALLSVVILHAEMIFRIRKNSVVG